MENIIGCTLIVKDDFNNALLLKVKTKRNEAERWTIISRKIRGKENYEKCIEKAVKDSIKTLIFDLKQVDEYTINDENNIVFVGNIKEKPMLDKAYNDFAWVSKRNIDAYNMNDDEKELLKKILK